MGMDGIDFVTAWVVMALAGRTRHGTRLFRVQCPGCTKEYVRTKHRLTTTHSCNRCSRIKHGTTHGLSKTPEYSAWASMRDRCANPKHASYKWYGAKGIRVAPVWDVPAGFLSFLAEVGPKPSRHHSLDRVNNALGYIPGNVTWSTAEAQARNQTRSHRIEYRGKVYCMKDLAVVTGYSAESLRRAFRNGKLQEKIATPPTERNSNNTVATRNALRAARGRCENPRNSKYKDYGGGGIKVHAVWCERRTGFARFLLEVGLRPSAQHSLDRIDNEGDYAPGNVRWSLPDTQSKNRCSTKHIEYAGTIKMLSEWARDLDIPLGTLSIRLKSGWSLERAFTTPARSRKPL